MPTAFPIRGQSSFVLRRAVGAKKASRPLFARVRRRRSGGRAGGPRQRLRKISHPCHATSVDSSGSAVSKKAATTAAALAQVLPMPALPLLSLLSSKKSIFLCPPSFPLSLYPTLSSLAELRLSLDMTADKGDGQRRRAILLGTFGRAEIVQCQSRKKFSRGNPKKLFLASSLARMLPSPTLRRKTKVRPGGTTPGTNANVVRSVVIQSECECEGLREGGVMQLMHHVQLCGGGAVRITGQGFSWVAICKVLHDSGPTRGLIE